MKENRLQTRVMKYMEKEGWDVFKMPPVKKGFPDIMALRNGNTFFMEMKRQDGKGRVSTEQARWLIRLRDNGFLVDVVDSWEKFMEVYDEALQLPVARHQSSLVEEVQG